jgi:hypothetical protein
MYALVAPYIFGHLHVVVVGEHRPPKSARIVLAIPKRLWSKPLPSVTYIDSKTLSLIGRRP